MGETGGAPAPLAVIDASVAIDALLGDGPARRVLASRQLFAPPLLDLEVLQALRREVQGERVPAAVASQLVTGFSALAITRYPVHGLADRIWELRENLPAYDAAYVAVAEALESPLVTADARIAGAPGLRCPVEVLPRH